MKPFVKHWTGSVILLCAFGVVSTTRAAQPAALSWLAGNLAVGQDRADDSTTRRRQCDDLLRKARQAMKEGQVSVAEEHLRRAEQLKVSYDNLFVRFTDTPEKVRKDLESLKQPERGAAPTKPSTRFQPQVENEPNTPKAAPGRPLAPSSGDAAERIGDAAEANATRALDRGLRSQFGGEPSAVANSTADRVPPLPSPRGLSDFVPPGQGPAGSNAPLPTNEPGSAAGDDARTQSDALLRAARQALAARDARKAAQLTAQARQIGVLYQQHEDSPEKIEQLIRKAAELPNPRTANVVPADSARQQSQFLLDEAEGLLRYREFDSAERLAREAKQLRAEYRPFERTPDRVLDQVDFQRRLGGTKPADGDTTPAAGSFAQRSGLAGGVQRLPAAGNEVVEGVSPAKQEALRLVAQAQAALDRGDAIKAQQLINRAQSLGVPDNSFQPGEPNPAIIALQIERAMVRREGTAQTGYQVEQALASDPRGKGYPVAQGVFNPTQDSSKVRPAQAEEPTAAVRAAPSVTMGGEGARLYEQGLTALEQQDRATALKLFREAWKHAGQMDPRVRAELRDKLSLLQEGPGGSSGGGADKEPSALEAVDAKQQLLKQKLQSEILGEKERAKRLLTTDPKAAVQRLQALRDRVNETELDPAARKQLLTLVDRDLNQFETFIEQNRSEIENTEQNRNVLEKVDRERRLKTESQNKLAEMVEEFNGLMDQARYAEAEVMAKKARNLDPENPVTTQLIWQSKFAIRIAEQEAIRASKEEGFYKAMTSVDRSSQPYDDSNPLTFDPQRWGDVNARGRKWMERQRRKQSPAEMEIQSALGKQVEVKFNNRPLSEVVETLQSAAGINIHLDAAGLGAEHISSDTPVTLILTQPISLRSALNLILQEKRLSFVIQNEVLKITSEQTRDADVYPRVYDVADLVIPIPNFGAATQMGLPNAIQDAYRAIGYGGGFSSPVGGSPLTIAANQPTRANGSVLAQMGGALLPNDRGRVPQSLGAGSGGLGVGAQPDFDSLIELITSTVSPQSWTEVGGNGSIERYTGNLSIVVSTTQDVHEQITDLLEQLRRLQDLQVTIEVRFITLRDNFFERMGIDFDFQIDDNSGLNLAVPNVPDDIGPSYAFGLGSGGQPTADLDIPFTQGSFVSTLPQFGGFDANTAANFGFAILSDIEVFFLLQAAAGDQRSNVLQAPKVTLFNGQQASVSDISQRPFVTSIIPVVGDFAAAHQPVIVVLNEGTSLTVQAVVSSDRRFVRLTMVPFFSKIGDVQTFTFAGKTTTKSGTTTKDPTNDKSTVKDNQEVTTEGTTVQLPTLASTSVQTTVSVPDGGTVLLGGIKRLSEARSERGVPMLNKLPYINRLFKNVGIGRETESLMLMVTPRIIIQEEEEAKLGIDTGS